MSAAFRASTKNPLLVKDDVGKAKTSCYDLPPEGFAYGRPDMPDYEGAREVTMQWVPHQPEERADLGVQNFRSLNKKALSKGALSAKDQTDFRKKTDMPLTHTPAQAPPRVFPNEVVPSFTYGKKTRPSTPIAQVVSNQFAAEFESAMDEMYNHYDEEKQRPGGHIIRTTKASEGHAKQRHTEVEKKEPFKLSKFKNIKGKLKLPNNTNIAQVMA